MDYSELLEKIKENNIILAAKMKKNKEALQNLQNQMDKGLIK